MVRDIYYLSQIYGYVR